MSLVPFPTCRPDPYSAAPSGDGPFAATTGGGIASRAMRSGIAANHRLGTTTSASWNATYFACRTTLAPIAFQNGRGQMANLG